MKTMIEVLSDRERARGRRPEYWTSTSALTWRSP